MSELYYLNGSPPSRAVDITAKLLGVKFTKKAVNLLKEDHLKDDFLAINPEHTIPVFVDEGDVLHESRAIMKHLVRKYGNGNHQLYPDDINKQYQIDRFLDFDIGSFFGRFKPMVVPFLKGAKCIDEESMQHFLEALGFLDAHLKGKIFITGDEYTLADISIATLASQLYMLRMNLSSYSSVNAWLKRCKTSIPHFDEDNVDSSAFKAFIDSKFEAE